MSLRSWVAEQLNDPTKVLHGTGVMTIIIELVHSWLSHTAVDMNKITVAFGCIAAGVAQDRINTPPVVPKTTT